MYIILCESLGSDRLQGSTDGRMAHVCNLHMYSVPSAEPEPYAFPVPPSQGVWRQFCLPILLLAAVLLGFILAAVFCFYPPEGQPHSRPHDFFKTSHAFAASTPPVIRTAAGALRIL